MKFKISNCHVTLHWSRNQRVMWLKMGASHCKSAPFLVWCQWVYCCCIYLICHVASQDHLIEGSCKFMGGSSLWYVTTLINIVTISIVIVEHGDHIFKGLCEFMGGCPSQLVTTLPCLVVIGLSKWIHKVFNMSRDLTKSCDWERELFMVCHHLASFSGHRYCRDMFKFVTQSSKTTWLKGRVTITIGAPQSKLPACQFRWSRDLARPTDQSFIWFYGREPLMASYNLAKFGGHRYCGVGDSF